MRPTPNGVRKSGERPVSKKELGARLFEKGFSDDRTVKRAFLVRN